MKHGKKYRSVIDKIDSSKTYSLLDAVSLIKENKVAKFDESVEVHVQLLVDIKKGDQQVRGSVALPHGTGKSQRIAVVTSLGEKEAKEAGADIVGGEEFIADIKSGKIDFDILVASPEMMPKLAGVAKILGPRGLMPSPKTETVTSKVGDAVRALKKGKASFKNDNGANVHQIVGKLSFTKEQLIENIDSFIVALEKAKPGTYKGKYIKSVFLCSTMGPSVSLQI